MAEFQRRWGRKSPRKSLESDVPEVPEVPADVVSAETGDLPFPLGNGGLDPVQVEMAERQNTRLGVVDPAARRLNVLFWLMQHYQESGDSDMAAEVKAAYYSLRNASPDVVTLVRIGELSEETLLLRLCNGQAWLNQEHEKWVNESSGSATNEAFQKALDGWAAMESQLRGQHGYQGCIHGKGQRCADDAVVSCDACLKILAEAKRAWSVDNA